MTTPDPTARNPHERALADAMRSAALGVPVPTVDVGAVRERVRLSRRRRDVLAVAGTTTALAGLLGLAGVVGPGALPGGVSGGTVMPGVQSPVSGASSDREPSSTATDATGTIANATDATAPTAQSPSPPAYSPPPGTPPPPGGTSAEDPEPVEPVEPVTVASSTLVVLVPEGVAPPETCVAVAPRSPDVRRLVVDTVRGWLQPTLDGVNDGLRALGGEPYVPTDDEIAGWIDADAVVEGLAGVPTYDCGRALGLGGPAGDAAATRLQDAADEIPVPDPADP